jgi:hypothetical protein
VRSTGSWRRIAGLVVTVVAGAAAVATTPPRSASIWQEVKGQVAVLAQRSPSVVRDILVHLNSAAVTEDLKSVGLDLSVEGSWSRLEGARVPPPAVRGLLIPAGVPFLPRQLQGDEELLVADGTSFALHSSVHDFNECEPGQSCTLRSRLTFELLDPHPVGTARLGWSLFSSVEYERTGDPPRGAKVRVTVRARAVPDRGASVTARLPTERIRLTPMAPEAHRFFTIRISPEAFSGSVRPRRMGIVAARLLSGRRLQERRSAVLVRFGLDPGTGGRGLHPAGGVEGFDPVDPAAWNCPLAPSGGAGFGTEPVCFARFEISFAGCEDCDVPFELEWWAQVELSYPGLQTAPPGARIDISAGAELREWVGDDVPVGKDGSVRRTLLIRVNTKGVPPDAVGAVAGWRGAQTSPEAASGGPSFSLIPPGRTLRDTEQEIDLLAECRRWDPCEADFLVDISYPGALRVWWDVKVTVRFDDRAELPRGSSVKVVIGAPP